MWSVQLDFIEIISLFLVSGWQLCRLFIPGQHLVNMAALGPDDLAARWETNSHCLCTTIGLGAVALDFGETLSFDIV